MNGLIGCSLDNLNAIDISFSDTHGHYFMPALGQVPGIHIFSKGSDLRNVTNI